MMKSVEAETKGVVSTDIGGDVVYNREVSADISFVCCVGDIDIRGWITSSAIS